MGISLIAAKTTHIERIIKLSFVKHQKSQFKTNFLQMDIYEFRATSFLTHAGLLIQQ